MKDAVPIVTGNFRPFRIVVRGENDKWAPTLEQINERSYDYVKLHRLSANIDVGIHPYNLGICFDGTLVLPALPKFRDPKVVLALFNRTLTELLVGGLYCEAVTPEDIGYGWLTFTGYSHMHGCGLGAAVTFHRAARTTLIGNFDVMHLLEPPAVSEVELRKALATGRALLGRVGEIPQEQVLYGTTFYVRKQWAESLIHIWTTTERIVELAWQKYVVSGKVHRKKSESDFLNDHRSWTVSTKLEVLFQKALLPYETLCLLDEVRKARNAFAHNGIAPTHPIATKALTGCFQLASLCASDFADRSLFDQIIRTVVEKCDPELHPKDGVRQIKDATHWMPVPPLPGDEKWEGEYEIIEELRLRPLSDTKYFPAKASPRKI